MFLDYHFPILKAQADSSSEEFTFIRYAEKECYAGVCDDYRLGSPLVFYLQNMHDYENGKNVSLAALSIDGTIMMPIEKKPSDEAVLKKRRENRESLIRRAKQGDEKAIENTYVIPLLMKNVKGIDHLLSGTPREDIDFSPSRTNTEYWRVPAKDYVLYCVKYMNPWQGKYIRRGVDEVTETGVNTDVLVNAKVVRKDMSMVNSDLEHYKENPVNQNDEVCGITTKNMSQAVFPVSFKTSGASISCNLLLTFNGNQCTISTDDENVTASGSGEFIVKGTEKAEYKDYQWGSNDGKPVQRDILRLAYNVKFSNVDFGDEKKHDYRDVQVSTSDTLVIQTRESNQRVLFKPKYVKQ
jgi:hypothetical protein